MRRHNGRHTKGAFKKRARKTHSLNKAVVRRGGTRL